MKKWISITVLAMFTIAIATAQSAFIKFDGIEGESTDRDHKGWSDLASFSQKLHQPTGAATGATRRRGNVVLEDIVCVKELDKSSVKLAESVTKGRYIPKVEIHLTKTSADGKRIVYYTYELKDVMISSYNIDYSDGLEKPVEEIALNYGEIKAAYTEYDNRGRKVGTTEYTYNAKTGN